MPKPGLIKRGEKGSVEEWKKRAKEDGFIEAHQTFSQVARVEKFHEERYRALLKNVQEGKVFQKASPLKWHCRNCGHVFEGKEAPEKCPVCAHPRAHFEVLAENY